MNNIYYEMDLEFGLKSGETKKTLLPKRIENKVFDLDLGDVYDISFSSHVEYDYKFLKENGMNHTGYITKLLGYEGFLYNWTTPIKNLKEAQKKLINKLAYKKLCLETILYCYRETEEILLNDEKAQYILNKSKDNLKNIDLLDITDEFLINGITDNKYIYKLFTKTNYKDNYYRVCIHPEDTLITSKKVTIKDIGDLCIKDELPNTSIKYTPFFDCIFVEGKPDSPLYYESMFDLAFLEGKDQFIKKIHDPEKQDQDAKKVPSLV